MPDFGRLALGAAGVFLALLWVSLVPAGDWPMWRYDAARRGASEEELPEKLNLQWVLELPAPRSAWPADQAKLQFDRLYEPVLGGKSLFVPSMLSDKVTSFDAETGKENWRFYADGPVRFAPVFWSGKLYFVSDDGYLYCLSASDGSLLWKFRGGPADRKVLGNDRLVSTWPARGAPVIYDKTIYFGASIWPFMGVFIHALDAETGEVVWTQSGAGSNYTVQQHDSPAFAGVAPQGYLAATEDLLVVAGGRTVPAVFDRKTGEYIHFNVASREMGEKGGGGYEVIVGKDYYLNRGDMYRLDDGRFLVKVDATVISENAMLGPDGENLRGYRPGWVEVEDKDKKKKNEVRVSWTSSVEEKIQKVFLRSGSRVYATSEKGALLGIDLPRGDKGARISWRTELPDTALNMIAGDGKLFVTTDKGRIYCFGEKAVEMPVPGKPSLALVARGATWKYLDDGSDQGTAWKSPGFDAAKWPAGPAQLGYGEGDEATKIGFGPDPAKKYITSYFRHEFETPGNFEYRGLVMKILVDDGAVVYLNGAEVARVSMPVGQVRQDTLAMANTAENQYEEVPLRGKSLFPGKNLLAVEVHQASRESSDVSFDLELSAEEALPYSRVQFPPDAWTETARQITARAGVHEGICLALGLGTGRLAEDLAAGSQLHVVVIEEDPRKVDAFRRRIDAVGAYGQRIAAVVGKPGEIDLAPYMADLIVAEEPRSLGLEKGPAVARIFQLLRPYSGTACFVLSEDGYRQLASAAQEAKLDKASLEHRDGFSVLARKGAPEGAGDWTHQYADAANTVVSKDSLVKAPLGILWFGGPSNEGVLPRHGHGPTPQVAAGRLVIQGRDMLRAMDIYTGRLLWQRTLKDVGQYYDYTTHEPGANAIGSNYVTLPDSVYVVHGKNCLRLDAATGQTIAEFHLPVPAGSTESPDIGYIGAWQDVLVLGGDPGAFVSHEYESSELGDLKGDALTKALAWVATWTGFEPIAKAKDQDDLHHFLANINKLLMSTDLVKLVPEAVRKEAKMDELEKKLAYYLAEVPGAKVSDPPALEMKRELLSRYYKLPAFQRKIPGRTGSHVRVGSRKLVGLDRMTGKVLWEIPANHEFRHNATVLGGGYLFAIDRMPDAQARFNKRHDRPLGPEGRLVALDIRTGSPRWSTDKKVFGTWLGYSEEHDVLLEAGSSGRDRSQDEAGQGMAAYRASKGDVLWRNEEKYSGPCLLHGDTIITQCNSDQPGFALELLTGKKEKRIQPLTSRTVDWQYWRNYGCNHAHGCANLLAFRSAAAGYFDLAGDGGTGNWGGFRSGCTNNLIPAGGVLCAPDYTRTCTCAYQNQTSLAMVYMPEVEMWSFAGFRHDGKPVQKVSINFGAPGDRRGPDGALWLDAPSVGGPSPDVPVDFDLDHGEFVRYHQSAVEGGNLEWVAASAVKGSGEIAVHLVAPLEFVVRNEVAGKNELRCKNSAYSAMVPSGTIPATGAQNWTSLGQGTAKGDLEAAVAGYESLASESITVELYARTCSDFVLVAARTPEKKEPSAFSIENRQTQVKYFVAGEKQGEKSEVTIKSKEKLPDEKWVHVAFTYDAATGVGTLYVDGKAVATNDGPDKRPLWWGAKSPDLIVAKDSDPGDRIDELRVCKIALAPAEFLSAKDAKVGAGKVLGYWRMESPGAPGAPAGPTSVGPAPVRTYKVRLVFAEIEGLGPGERVFDVLLQGNLCLEDFDIARAAGGPKRTVVREFHDVVVRDHLRIGLVPKKGEKPMLNGVQAIATSREF